MQSNVASAPHLRRIGSLLIIASVAAILVATLLPEPGPPVTSHLCLVCGTLGAVDTVLNVLLFVPLGVALALYGIPSRRAILLMSVLSLTVEAAQFFVIAGRDASVGDVLTNTLGGALGFVASRCPLVWLRPTPRNATGLLVGWCAIWLTIQLIASSAFSASIPESQYYGQLAPTLGNYSVFPGRVLTASIDNITIPNTAFPNRRLVQEHLMRGATVAATALPAQHPADLAPIVRVADAEQREIVLLAQNHADFVFGVRSRAAALRLRPPLFALRQVFPRREGEGRASLDTIAVSGRYLSHEVQMTARTTTRTEGSVVPLTSSLGWTLVWPSQWLIQGTPPERIISGIWIACLMLPFGFWAYRRLRRAPTRSALRLRTVLWPVSVVTICGALALVGGLAIAPDAFGLSPTPMTDWLAALSGAVIGVMLARGTAEAKVSSKNDDPSTAI